MKTSYESLKGYYEEYKEDCKTNERHRTGRKRNVH